MGETGDNIAIQDFGLYSLILSHVFLGMRRQNAESDPTAVHTPALGAGDNLEFGKFQFPG